MVWPHSLLWELLNIAASSTAGPLLVSCSRVGRGRSPLSGPRQMSWGQATAMSRLHLSNRCPSVSSGCLLLSEQAQTSQGKHLPTNLPPPQKGLQGAYLFDNIPKVTETRAEQVSRTRKRLGESEPPATLLVQEAVKCCSLEHEELLGLLVGQGDTWSKAQGLGCQGEWMNPCSDSGATDVCARDTWSKIHNTPSSSCPQGPCILP